MPNTPARRSRNAWLAAAALILLAAFVAWFLRGGRASAPAAIGGPAVLPAPPSAAALREVEEHESALRNAVAGESARIEEAPVAATAPAAAPPVELPDLEARDWLVLRVVDPRQVPIFDAGVTIRGLRKEGDLGSWYSRRDEAATVRTDREGRARLSFERWTDIDGRTLQVDLLVEHLDFISFNDSSFVLAQGEQVVVLEQGSLIWLSAWHGSRDRRIADVQIAVEWEAQLGQDGWQPEPDGRWSTTRLAPGAHWITVTHTSAELGALASEFTYFELALHARLDLELELKPLVTLRGKLDDAVPRPIVDGHVWVNLHASRDSIGLSSDHQAPVAADGTFELRGLRPASGQVIALCDGWVSKLVPPRTLEESSRQVHADLSAAEHADLLAQAQAEERGAQAVDASDAQVLVVVMEPTGTLEVRVIDEQGTALAGVMVNASPNVQWKGVGATIFPWRDWNTVTDAHGMGRIENLPPDDSLWFGAQSGTHQMRKADRDHTPRAVIESGKTTLSELVLEKLPE